MWFKTKAECFKPGYLHIAKDINTQGSKMYTHVKSYTDIIDIINSEKCVYEIVTGQWTEMYDFDGVGIPKEQLPNIVENFKNIYYQTNPTQKVHYKICISPNKLSIHFIIPKSVFPSYREMKQRFDRVISHPDILFRECYDNTIYTKDRLIRTNRSDKTFSGRIFSSPSDDLDLFVSFPLVALPTTFTLPAASDTLLQKYNLHKTFTIDKEIRSNVFRLKRIAPSMCLICQRIHDHENAYIDIIEMSYGCYRNPHQKQFLDPDVIRVDVPKLTKILTGYGLNSQDIDYIISRSKV